MVFYQKTKCTSGEGTTNHFRGINSPQVFSEVRVAQSFVFCAVFSVCHCLFSCPFSFGHFIVCPSRLYGFTASDCPFGIFKLFLKKGYLYVYILSLVFYAIKKRNVVTLVCRDIMWIMWNLNISIALQYIHFSFTNFWPFVIQSFSNTSRGWAGFWIDFQISQNIHMLNEFKLKPIYAIWWNICFMQWQPSWMVFRAVKHNFERGQPKMNLLLVTMAIWNGERRCW